VLPVNGASVDFPHLQPASPLPAVLTPEQAVQAAAILRANTLVPMHFGVDEPPYDAEEPDLLGRAEAAAARLALMLSVLQAGESLDIGTRRAA
jgi:L-ascorbate metabolism protein UlaG (beta-lactamase superfamily)